MKRAAKVLLVLVAAGTLWLPLTEAVHGALHATKSSLHHHDHHGPHHSAHNHTKVRKVINLLTRATDVDQNQSHVFLFLFVHPYAENCSYTVALRNIDLRSAASARSLSFPPPTPPPVQSLT